MPEPIAYVTPHLPSFREKVCWGPPSAEEILAELPVGDLNRFPLETLSRPPTEKFVRVCDFSQSGVRLREQRLIREQRRGKGGGAGEDLATLRKNLQEEDAFKLVDSAAAKGGFKKKGGTLSLYHAFLLHENNFDFEINYFRISFLKKTF